jgi:hypothetical protein
MSTVSAGVRRSLRRLSAISGDSGIQRRGSYVWPSGEEDYSMNLKPKVTAAFNQFNVYEYTIGHVHHCVKHSVAESVKAVVNMPYSVGQLDDCLQLMYIHIHNYWAHRPNTCTVLGI